MKLAGYVAAIIQIARQPGGWSTSHNWRRAKRSRLPLRPTAVISRARAELCTGRSTTTGRSFPGAVSTTSVVGRPCIIWRGGSFSPVLVSAG